MQSRVRNAVLSGKIDEKYIHLGVVVRLFCGVMHNITKSEKSLYYGVF